MSAFIGLLVSITYTLMSSPSPFPAAGTILLSSHLNIHLTSSNCSYKKHNDLSKDLIIPLKLLIS